MYKKSFICALFTFLVLSAPPTLAQHSVARQWNEALLTAISNDKAFPTIQARNLLHTSIAMYDAWTVYSDGPEQTYLLGQTVNGFAVPFAGVPRPDDVEEARRQAMSYAAYRLIEHRFASSPGAGTMFNRIGTLMTQLGYDPNFTATDYADGNPAALGNYIAQKLIQFGLQDGANEQGDYRSRYYTPLNPSLDPSLPDHNGLIDPNFWQPLKLGEYDDFLTPEWGSMMPFSLGEEDLTMYQRDGDNYPVYHDPGPPPHKWNEALLTAISNDKAFPTIQARNLLHTSIAMYDAWTVYSDGPEQTYLLGQTVNGFAVPFAGVPRPDDVEEARRQAMSYAAYRLIEHRFASSPGAGTMFNRIGTLMTQLGYDPNFTATDYADGNPAALGNYIAQKLIQFGLQDGANEQGDYRSRYYTPLNPSLDPSLPDHNGLIDPNFWQPLKLGEYDDFLTPEWGSMMPFSLGEEDLTMYQRDGDNYPVYHDPGPPPHNKYSAGGPRPRRSENVVRRVSMGLCPRRALVVPSRPG